MKKTQLFMSALAGLAALITSSASGQVANINTQPPAVNNSEKSMIKVDTGSGEILVIAIDDPLSGSEIWRSDGSEVGTKQIRDLLPGANGSEPVFLTASGNRVFFSAATPGGNQGLWVTNGQLSGTNLLKEFPSNNGPEKFTSYNGNLYFVGFENSAGRELWTSNGTAAGTNQLANINTASSQGSAIDYFVTFNNSLYFTAFDGTHNRELWKTDGVSATSLVEDIVVGSDTPFPTGDPEFTVMNDKLYFVANTGANGTELWVTNGTAAAAIVKDITTVNSSLSSSPKSLAVMALATSTTNNPAGNYLYFSADDGTNGRELWRSDGVAGAESKTQMVKNIATGSASSNVDNLTVVGNTLFFTASDAAGIELFRSSGRINADGETVQVSNINTSGDSNPTNLTPFGSVLIFTAVDSTNNLGLYSCAAPLGTVGAAIKQFGVGSTASHFTEINGSLYFLVTIPVATSQGHVTELWVTNGVNSAGTTRIKSFQSGDSGSSATGVTVVNNDEVYFSATDGLTGQELWKTDGTSEGTSQIKDIRAGSNGSDPQSITPVGDKVFFTADDTGTNRELWITDGTEEGTSIVLTNESAEIYPSGGSNPTNLTQIDGLLYFSARGKDGGSDTGFEPWVADPTTGTATKFAELGVGSSSSNPRSFIFYNSKVYFVAGQSLRERTAPDNVTIIQSAAINPTSLVVAGTGTNAKLFFAAGHQTKGTELWKSDGIDDGTQIIDIIDGSVSSSPTSLTVVGSWVYFAATDSANTGTELWRSNGELNGTTLVKDIRVGGNSSPENLTEAGGKLFFTADNGTNGRELWVSNGTSAGTVMVKDIRAGSESSEITNMRNIDGILCFSADDGINGRELWLSDGTSNGTIMLEDLAPSSASSNPGNFTSFKGQLLFTAATPEVGDELRTEFIGPNIEVQQPVGVALAMNDTVNFGSVVFKAAPVTLPFVIKNTGRNVLTGVKPIISGINASEFTLVGKAAVSVSGNSSTAFSIKFSPKEGGLRTATLSILSNDADENPFVLKLEGNGIKDPEITDHPESLMRKVGQSASFTADATSAGTLLPNWKKGSSTLKTETGKTLTLPAVTIKDGAAYSYFVKGTSATAQSNPAELGVVEDNSPPLVIVQGEGKAVTFKVNASGNQLSYQWFKDDQALSDGASITGAKAKTMTIKGITTDDTGLYTCEVTNPGGTETGGSTQLNVFAEAPDVLSNQDMPNGIVGGDYYHKIVIDPAPEKAALTYAAKNLPTGLKLNTKTGEIAGRPTKAGNFAVELTAKNNFGTDIEIITPDVNIEEFPAGVEGVYAGIVDHNVVLNGSLGGRLDVTITKTGSFSGSLLLGTSKLPLKGAVNVFRAEDDTDPISTVELKPSSKTGLPASVTLTFEINPETGLLTSASKVTGAGEEALIEGWRKLDLATAVDYDGTYNFGLKLGDPEQQDILFEDLIPQGWSFGSFKCAKGALKIAGRTADGDKITCSSFVGMDGKVVFYQTMYKPLPGSMVGSLTIDPQDTGAAEGAATDNTLTGQVEWVKPNDSKSKTRTYVAGFGFPGMEVDSPVPLDATGAIYVKPTGLLFGLSAPADLELTFDFGGLAPDNGDEVDATVTLNTGNKLIQDPDTTTATKLAINAGTGALTGGFTLDGRKSALFGLLIKDSTDGGIEKGVGFFTLPEDTTKTSPILGGKVELEPVELP